MKNKFKLIISSIIVLLLVISVVFYFSYRNRLEKEINRINEIRNDVKKEAEIYLSIVYPTGNNEGKEAWLYDEHIVSGYYRGAPKDILLQYKKKDYCKASIHAKVINSKWEADVALKCDIKMPLRTIHFIDSKYEENIEYLKCITVLPEEYYEIDFEHFKCPQDKLDYIEENYKNK